MEISKAFAACEAAVRKHDPDRYLSALFAPAGKRPLLFALYAFNYELARVAETARQPMMGEIRLQWWRETVEAAKAGRPRAHDVARALSATLALADLPAELFEAMIDARAFDFSVERFADDAARDAYLDATSGNLMRLAGRVLGARDTQDELAREAGLAYGLAGLWRAKAFHRARGKVFLPDNSQAPKDARDHFTRARALPKPGNAAAAFLSAALVPLYLKYGERKVPLHRKQITMLSASLRGRL